MKLSNISVQLIFVQSLQLSVSRHIAALLSGDMGPLPPPAVEWALFIYMSEKMAGFDQKYKAINQSLAES